ncbi:hypothetical protein K501DRAFT_287674 [Backusella circina FSU 941]|nr:hypothetical protein K501DRAFT_287674 [Backusella circina FSU 941]
MPFLSSSRDCQFQQEIPVTTPIFEGHLYTRNEKRNWTWRLFRFDGSFFTCLSTHKLKTEPSTESIPLLLSTPKDTSKRLTTDKKTELKYYQLPEWTVDLTQVSSINVLKKVKSHNNYNRSRCFSIRTFQGACYVLKAQKHKDLERWLFVLSKMWKFTQAVKEQQERLLQYDAQDHIPLVHSIKQQPQQQQQQSSYPNLSEEKVQVIEKWRTSLAELMANDPTIRVSTPPPIESLPDDDAVSVFTDMTSISNRPKTLKRRTRSSVVVRRNNTTKTNSVAPSGGGETLPLEKGGDQRSPTLRKKRSDDVRNWMNRSLRKPMIQKTGSQVSTSPEIYHIRYFQDEITSVCHDENCNCNIQQQQGGKLRYHNSLRGKQVQLVQNEQERIRAYYNKANVFEDAQLNSLSPLQFLAIKDEDEEEMSLADLQKSLRKVQQEDWKRAPSTYSMDAPIVAPVNSLYRKQRHSSYFF